MADAENEDRRKESVEAEDGSNCESSDESIDESNFASFFVNFAETESGQERSTSSESHLTKKEKEIAWQKMLQEQDPYARDAKLPEFTFQKIVISNVPIQIRNCCAAEYRSLGTGRVVWPIAQRIARHLADCVQIENHPFNVKDQVVLELGSGPGFLSIFAKKLGAKHVTMTDQASLLPLMRMNCSDNGIQLHQEITVATLDWCEKQRTIFAPGPPSSNLVAQKLPAHSDNSKHVSVAPASDYLDQDQMKGEFDIILCSDLIYSDYNRDPCTPLRTTLNRYMASEAHHTITLFAFRERGVLTLDDSQGEVRQFFRLLQAEHNITSTQIEIDNLFGENCDGYRLFLLERKKSNKS